MLKQKENFLLDICPTEIIIKCCDPENPSRTWRRGATGVRCCQEALHRWLQARSRRSSGTATTTRSSSWSWRGRDSPGSASPSPRPGAGRTSARYSSRMSTLTSRPPTASRAATVAAGAGCQHCRQSRMTSCGLKQTTRSLTKVPLKHNTIKTTYPVTSRRIHPRSWRWCPSRRSSQQVRARRRSAAAGWSRMVASTWLRTAAATSTDLHRLHHTDTINPRVAAYSPSEVFKSVAGCGCT